MPFHAESAAILSPFLKLTVRSGFYNIYQYLFIVSVKEGPKNSIEFVCLFVSGHIPSYCINLQRLDTVKNIFAINLISRKLIQSRL